MHSWLHGHTFFNGITANGDTATADIAIRESTVRLSYVKQDGKWKLDRWRAAAVDPTQDGRPSITRGLSVPATVRAYYTAIGSENGAALCGLLSKNEARRLLRDSSEDQPRLACVQALNDFDWAAAKKKAGNARILGSVTAGNGARVRVSNGTRLSLARTRNGRWVIDGLASR
jgi:hypothetical protein